MSDYAPQLNAANIDNGLIRLNWSDATGSIFHPIWLRIIADRLGLARDANPLLRCAYGYCRYRGAEMNITDMTDKPHQRGMNLL